MENQNNHSVWFLDFLVQLFSATVVSVVIGETVGFLLSLPIGFFSFQSGSIVDLAVDSRFFHYFVDGPFFLTAILAALFLGAWSFHSAPRSPSASWTWVVPALFLLCHLQPWSFRSQDLSIAWNNLFGPNCGNTECLMELFVTAPFFTSIAYSVGRVVQKRRLRSG
jgi:hypothetical protein